MLVGSCFCNVSSDLFMSVAVKQISGEKSKECLH